MIPALWGGNLCRDPIKAPTPVSLPSQMHRDSRNKNTPGAICVSECQKGIRKYGGGGWGWKRDRKQLEKCLKACKGRNCPGAAITDPSKHAPKIQISHSENSQPMARERTEDAKRPVWHPNSTKCPISQSLDSF